MNVDLVHRNFCKKVLELPKSSPNGVAQCELGRVGSKGKIMERVLKYWFRLRNLDESNILKQCLIVQEKISQRLTWANRIKELME